MKKTIIIGVTGHRDIVETTALKNSIRKIFINLYDKNEKVELLSPLADGADRLVADIYLEVFKEKAKLIVPMPFEQERYMEDFNKLSKIKFLNYLKVANNVFEVENHAGCNYKSVGNYIIDHSNILLALWDGTFNHKSGGTADIVQYAKGAGKEVKHFACERLIN